jgi:hypothetical protein
LIGPSQKKKLKLWRLSKIKVCSCRIECFPIGLAIYVRKGRTFGQSIGDKSVVLLETYWGTHWELGETLWNFVETP